MRAVLSTLFWAFLVGSSFLLFPIAVAIWAITLPFDPRLPRALAAGQTGLELGGTRESIIECWTGVHQLLVAGAPGPSGIGPDQEGGGREASWSDHL